MVEGLKFTYPGTDTPILNGITFNVEAGERIAIIGRNGIGKTTLMQVLAGQLPPTAGTMTWVENAQVGYMPQDPQAEFADKTCSSGCRAGQARRMTSRSFVPRSAACCSAATR